MKNTCTEALGQFRFYIHIEKHVLFSVFLRKKGEVSSFFFFSLGGLCVCVCVGSMMSCDEGSSRDVHETIRFVINDHLARSISLHFFYVYIKLTEGRKKREENIQ